MAEQDLEGIPTMQAVEKSTVEQTAQYEAVKHGSEVKMEGVYLEKNKNNRLIMKDVTGKDIRVNFPGAREVIKYALKYPKRLNGLDLKQFLIAYAQRQEEAPQAEGEAKVSHYGMFLAQLRRVMKKSDMLELEGHVRKDIKIDWSRVDAEVGQQIKSEEPEEAVEEEQGGAERIAV